MAPMQLSVCGNDRFMGPERWSFTIAKAVNRYLPGQPDVLE